MTVITVGLLRSVTWRLTSLLTVTIIVTTVTVDLSHDPDHTVVTIH